MRDWLSHRVVSSPDDVALVRAEDGEAWTYTDLDRLVSETAGRLAAHGIGPGDKVGVVTPPYVGTVGLIHAAMRIGATFVPLGEGLTERELAARIDGVDLSAVVCAESTEGEALDAVSRTDSVPVFSVDDPVDEAVTGVHDAEPESADPATWAFDDTLCVLFTSGTTGDPKPVPLTAGNVYSSAVASAFRLGVEPDDRWLVSLALHHMGGLAPVYRSALYGTTLVLREGFDPGGTADDIDTYDVTGVSLVPTMLQQMLDRRGTLSESLRAVLLGGAPAPDELLERCRDYSIPVFPTYGMTEAASQIATAAPRQTRDRLDTVGRPVFGTDVTVVDEDDTPVGPGETGEIVVDGPTVTPGYIDADADGDALDRSAFGEYGLHTGDVGRLDDDGFLYVLNRLDDRIISGGENVEPGEVVDVFREFPAVEDVAVVGLDDEVWGERVSALVAVGDQFRAGDEPIAVGDAAEPDESASDDGGPSQSGDRTEASGDDDSDGDGDGGASGTDGRGGDGESDGESDRDGDDLVSSRASEAPPIDESALMQFAADRLAGFKLPKTVAYADELPRTVSGTIDREAVKATLRNRGHNPRDGTEEALEMAGFKPADPAEPPEQGTQRSGDEDGAKPDGADTAGAETGTDGEKTDTEDAAASGDSDDGNDTGDGRRDADGDVTIPDAEETADSNAVREGSDVGDVGREGSDAEREGADAEREGADAEREGADESDATGSSGRP